MNVRPNCTVENPVFGGSVLAGLRKMSSDLSWPLFGSNAEMTSLLWHGSRRDNLTDGPDARVCDAIVEAIVRNLDFMRYDLPNDLFSRDHFDRELMDVERNSSPGYPYCAAVSNNGQLLGWNGVSYAKPLVDSIWNTVSARISQPESDPIRLFVKPEPHSAGKMKDRRYRLISSVSLPDRMVDAMCCSSMNKTMVNKWPLGPFRVGWAPTGGGYLMVPISGMYSTDCSGWDWSVKMWIFQILLRVRLALCNNPTELWVAALTQRYMQLYEKPLFVTSGGLFFRQKQPGVQKSGCYNTLHDNSMAQYILHIAACMVTGSPYGYVVILGDDVLRSYQNEHFYRALQQWCHVKTVEPLSHFCGFDFCAGCVVDPLYFEKHCFKLLYSEQKQEKMDELARSYSLLYHRSKRRGMMAEAISQMSNQALTESDLDLIWDG